MDTYPDYWRTDMDEKTARAVLGSKHFDWASTRGAGYIAGRMRGCWDANLAESYAAYRCALGTAQLPTS